MRSALALVVAAGCSFHLHGAGDDTGDASGMAALVDDTAADFGASDTLDSAVIDPGGAIEPAAFVLGGFHVRGYLGDLVGSAATWADIDTAAAAIPMTGEAYAQLPIDWGGGHPRGLALDTDDKFTVIYDGELLIPAGDHMVSFDADDNAAAQLDQQFVLAPLNVQTLSIHEDAPTWVPLHAALAEHTGGAKLVVRIDGTQVTADQARARVNQAHGRGVLVSYLVVATGEPSPSPVIAAPNVNWGMTAPPYDLDGPQTSYTARFMGQLRIDADGSYTLATTTGSVDDSSAIYLDRHLISRTSAFTDTHPAVATLDLTAGWHSIVVELSGTQKNVLGNTDPHAVTLATTLNGAPITADMLRPAVDSGYLAQAVSNYAPLADTSANNGVTTIGVPASTPPPPAGATIDSASIGYFYYHAAPTDYTTVADLAGTPLAMPSTGPIVFAAGDETAAGTAVPQAANAWSFTFTDTVQGDSSGYSDPYAAVFAGYTFHGGPQVPFAMRLMYVSSARSLTGITAFKALRVTGDLAGATATIAVRTAATAQDLESAGWVDVENGTIPTAAPLPYVQYRIVVTGDGWQYPVVDKVEIDYLTR
jgi:hypothetical protein